VTAAVPVLLKVTTWGLLVLPRVTLPKLRVAGEAESVKLGVRSPSG